MSEFSLPSTSTPLKNPHFSTLLLSDFFLFCSFILSHPLYFFYFIFFFPYLFKLLSFLSPLFFTTFLLLSAFLTFSPNLLHDSLTESNFTLVLSTYQAVAEKLRPKIEENGKEEVHQFEELDVYKIVFDTSEFDLEQGLHQYPPEIEIKEEIFSIPSSTINVAEEEKNTNLDVNSIVIPIRYEKEEIGEKEVKVMSENIKKVEEKKYPNRVSKEMGLGHKAIEDDDSEYLPRASSERTQQNPWIYDNGDGFYTPKSVEKSPSMRSNGSFGSMRKEKEWRRTLACKLFEERHHQNAGAGDGDGSEGMDMLWETYETDSMKLQRKKNKSKRGKKVNIDHEDEEDDYDEDDDEDDNNAQLCCLQALKFSAGKMNLGMRRPNLVKISKAFKGIGWLHHVSKKKSNYH